MVMSGHARQLRGNLDFSSLATNKVAVVAGPTQQLAKWTPAFQRMVWQSLIDDQLQLFSLSNWKVSLHLAMIDSTQTDQRACVCVCVRAFQWHSARAR